MTRSNYTLPSQRKAGSSVVSSKPQIYNKTLEAEYYRKLVEAIPQRKPKVADPVKEERNRLIAADLRSLPLYMVVNKWGISPITVDKIRGDMDLGKY